MTDILSGIQAKLKAPKDKENTFGKYKYRNTESILRAFKEVQPEDVSLTMSDNIEFIGSRLFLVATVKLHHAGTVIAEAQGAAMHAMEKKGMDDAQITGACSSYARKYALCGLFAIDDSADDPDGKDNRHNDTDDGRKATHEQNPRNAAPKDGKPPVRDPVTIAASLVEAIDKATTQDGMELMNADGTKFAMAWQWLEDEDHKQQAAKVKAAWDARFAALANADLDGDQIPH